VERDRLAGDRVVGHRLVSDRMGVRCLERHGMELDGLGSHRMERYGVERHGMELDGLGFNRLEQHRLEFGGVERLYGVLYRMGAPGFRNERAGPPPQETAPLGGS
jgi:hypothetical protein